MGVKVRKDEINRLKGAKKSKIKIDRTEYRKVNKDILPPMP
jgi:hypothetical protein